MVNLTRPEPHAVARARFLEYSGTAALTNFSWLALEFGAWQVGQSLHTAVLSSVWSGLERDARALEVAGLDTDALEDVVDGYLDAMLWTHSMLDSDDFLDSHYTRDDVSDEYREDVRGDVVEFVRRCPLAVRLHVRGLMFDAGHGNVWHHLGHDLALTRNGHGTGLWDRDYTRSGLSREASTRLGQYLTDKLEPFGEDDGIHDALGAWEDEDTDVSPASGEQYVMGYRTAVERYVSAVPVTPAEPEPVALAAVEDEPNATRWVLEVKDTDGWKAYRGVFPGDADESRALSEARSITEQARAFGESRPMRLVRVFAYGE